MGLVPGGERDEEMSLRGSNSFTKTDLVELNKGLHSNHAFTLRRAQILLSSSQGQSVSQIADSLYCCKATVRKVIHSFREEGIGSLRPRHREIRVRPPITEVKDTFTVSEAAQFLSIHANSVRRWSDLGRLPGYRIGNRGDRRFRRYDLDSLLISTPKGTR